MKRQPELPGWAQELRQRYLAGEASLFLLHGNVRDLYPWESPDGSVRYVSLREFLERFLSRSKDIVAYYNCSEGIEFAEKGMAGRFRRAVNSKRTLQGLGDAEINQSRFFNTGDDFNRKPEGFFGSWNKVGGVFCFA